MSRGQRFGTALARGAERAVLARLGQKMTLAYNAAKAAEQGDLKGLTTCVVAMYSPNIAAGIKVANALHNHDYVGAACIAGSAYADHKSENSTSTTTPNSYGKIGDGFRVIGGYHQNG